MAKKITTSLRKGGSGNLIKKQEPLAGNALMLVVIIVALVGTSAYIAYQSGRLKELERTTKEPTPEPTAEPTAIQLPTPTTAPQPQQNTYTAPQQQQVVNTPFPTPPPERKKVPIFIDDNGGLTKGNFYCYEDKVNELADLQNQIRIYQSVADSCNANEQSKASQCSSSCTTQPDIASCVDACYANATSNCNDKNTKVGDLRKELYSKVHQYCP